MGEKGENEKDCFEEVLSQLKKMVSEGRKEKRCDHRSHKDKERGGDAHASCREERERNEQQLRSLKEVVKTLDQEIGNLREEGQLLADRLASSSEKLSKLEQKARKLGEENDSANSQVERLMQENSYKNKLIEEYLRIVSKLEDAARDHEAAALVGHGNRPAVSPQFRIAARRDRLHRVGQGAVSGLERGQGVVPRRGRGRRRGRRCSGRRTIRGGCRRRGRGTCRSTRRR